MASLIGSKTEQNAMKLLASHSGRLLEPVGNNWPRWMIIGAQASQNPGYRKSPSLSFPSPHADSGSTLCGLCHLADVRLYSRQPMPTPGIAAATRRHYATSSEASSDASSSVAMISSAYWRTTEVSCPLRRAAAYKRLKRLRASNPRVRMHIV